MLLLQKREALAADGDELRGGFHKRGGDAREILKHGHFAEQVAGLYRFRDFAVEEQFYLTVDHHVHFVRHVTDGKHEFTGLVKSWSLSVGVYMNIYGWQPPESLERWHCNRRPGPGEARRRYECVTSGGGKAIA